MKKYLISLFAALSFSAYANYPAVVVAVYPYQTLGWTTTTECRQVPVPVQQYQHNYYYQNDGNLGGAVAGAIIGSQFGNGDGRRAAIIAGTIIGYNHQHRRYHPPVTVYQYQTVCSPVQSRTMVPSGYQVTVRLPDGQNRMIITYNEPSIGSIIYLPY